MFSFCTVVLLVIYRETNGILQYQGFPRPILPTKHPERSEESFKLDGCLASEKGSKVRNWMVVLLVKSR